MDNQLIKPKVFGKDGGTDIWLRARKKIKRKQGEIKRERGRKTKQGKGGGEESWHGSHCPPLLGLQDMPVELTNQLVSNEQK